MAGASIGGLVSGLDTATIISQLIQLEARPQTMLKSRVSSEQRAITAMQTLNTKLAAIGAKAADLAKLESWSPMKATSSHDKVSVTAVSGAVSGSLSFTIDALASAAANTYAITATSSAPAVLPANTTLTIDFGDSRTSTSVNSGDGSLNALVVALNQSGKGVDAVLVRNGTDGTGAPTYALTVTDESTGAASGFTITTPDGQPILGGVVTPKAGTDASLTISGQAQPLTSASNTIKGLMPGVDVTLAADAKVGESATITIAKDTDKVAGQVKAMVDAVNAALSEIASLTKTGADPKERGLLAGDTTLRGVGNQLLQAITGGVDDKSLAPYGIQTDRYGKLTFDEATFKAAYAADPTATAAMFAGADDTTKTDGLAGTLQQLSKAFSDSIDGTVTGAIKSRQSQIKGWEDDIADWDVRLATKQAALQRQYTALESALGKLQSQGNWLAGQIAGLPSWNSGQ